MKKDDALDDDCDIKNTLPAVLGAFILGNSGRIMKNFITEKKTDFTKITYIIQIPIVSIYRKNIGMC